MKLQNSLQLSLYTAILLSLPAVPAVLLPASAIGAPGNAGNAKGNIEPGKYAIRQGDNPSKISKRTGIPLEEILKCNPKLDAKKLKPGKEIKLHDVYTLKFGDTLSKIARRYGSTRSELLDYNERIKDADDINAGDKMAVPCGRAGREKVKRTGAKGKYENDEKENGKYHPKQSSQSQFSQSSKRKAKPVRTVRYLSGLELEIVTDKKLIGTGALFDDPLDSGVPLVRIRRSDLGKKLSPHFSVGEAVQVEETQCIGQYQKAGHIHKMAGDLYFAYGRIDPELIVKLETLRAAAGIMLPIDEGYRPPSYNRCGGGAPRSMHLAGKAVDIDLPGGRLYKKADKIFGQHSGIGVGPKVLHIDKRRNYARWHY